jgi:SAM-dependent methyltransferase
MDWDTRFATRDYLFGRRPAAFLAAQAHHIPSAARVLCVADGEGRNSVHLAGLGHDVTAFDLSPNAIDKARALAAEAGVVVDLNVSTLEHWDWAQPVDALVAIFIQFLSPAARASVFADFARAVRPGGLVFLHGYAPRQVGYGTGGPKAVENMYTEALLREAFDGWDVVHSADYDARIDEGTAHSGLSALVDFIARKPGH